MMKDGRPAFPVLDGKYGYEGEYLGVESISNGMTLRDWFAGQALAGIASGVNWFTANDWTKAAKCAYGVADAMLEERKK